RCRQSRQSATGGGGACRGAVLRRAGVDAGGGAIGADCRHLLQGRSDRRADALRGRRDRTADGKRHGHRRGCDQDPTPPRRLDIARAGYMRQEVIARQVRAMKESGLDAVLSISPENFAYVTGFLSPTAPLMRWRHAMALVTANAATALVVVDMEANTI